MADLQVGAADPRGRMVLEILWAVNEFKIYKTTNGISPFFSDVPTEARTQKLAYLELGSGIAEFNHLIQILEPPFIPFISKIFINKTSHENLVYYERELARCIAQALLGQVEQAEASLAELLDRLAARISNRGRVAHLLVNIVLVLLIILASMVLLQSDYVSKFGFNFQEISLAIMMGSVGALFSTTVRLQSMAVDPSVTQYMHWVYAFQRVIVGALGALILYFGFQSGVLRDLLTGSGNLPPSTVGINPYWLSFVCLLAGFSERLVPNLLEARTSPEYGAEATS
ncbi:hypothetical protein [Ruegeria sp. HKCCD8929]|uniref:hypothetical protein n=1 Tax=Ruegeria sp. HKCCD8929 TaxID=2683006 RepID=UPI0014897079|nr:hypothetical protein [Ruegeria sp. HKCCD8929]